MPRKFKNHPAYRLINSRYRGHQTWPLDLTASNSVSAGRTHTATPTDAHLPRQIRDSSMQRTALRQAGIPAHEIPAEIARLNKIATTAAVDAAFALAAERSRIAAEAAQTAEEREHAEYWIERWVSATADQVHPDDFEQLERDLEYQIQWALAQVDGIYIPEVSRHFIEDYQQHGRHFALARSHHEEAYAWVRPEERRQELLKKAWSHSPIEPFIDESGDIRLFHTVDEQRDAERERDQPASTRRPSAGESAPMRPTRHWPADFRRLWRRT